MHDDKGCLSLDSYIKPQRKQNRLCMALRCLSLDSYIKPQPAVPRMWHCARCLSLDSYIKPQHATNIEREHIVVYLLIPTSNHNLLVALSARAKLFIS